MYNNIPAFFTNQKLRAKIAALSYEELCTELSSHEDNIKEQLTVNHADAPALHRATHEAGRSYEIIAYICDVMYQRGMIRDAIQTHPTCLLYTSDAADE